MLRKIVLVLGFEVPTKQTVGGLSRKASESQALWLTAHCSTRSLVKHQVQGLVSSQHGYGKIGKI